MQIVPSLLFGISASLDALLTGTVFGIRGTRIRFRQNLLISCITLVGTCLSVGLGSRLVMSAPAILWNLAGSLVLILFGIYYLIKFMIYFLKKYRECKQLIAAQVSEKSSSGRHFPEKNSSGRNSPPPSAMTLREACALGCALSANNIGIGLSASIAGLSLLPAASVTFFFSLAFLYLGNRFGQSHVLSFSERTADLISGMLLILLGVLELIC